MCPRDAVAAAALGPPVLDHTIDGGTIWLLRLLDVADLVDLDRARVLTPEQGGRRGGLAIRGPEKGPSGVRLATPPLDLDAGTAMVLGIQARATVRVFDFGVASVRLAVDIAPGTTCDELIKLAVLFEQHSTAIDVVAREIWSPLAKLLGNSLRAAHAPDLIEDYLLFEVTHVQGCATAVEAMTALHPAKLLLAEPDRPLANPLVESYLSRAIQYYADDCAVIGWNAALVIDPERSRDELEVLEIATARLLELRFYDGVLGRELASVYSATEAARGSNTLFRSPFIKVARRAATLFVEITDLYDRAEGAITLVGDAHNARIYREAVHRFRLDEISAGVRDKLGTLAKVSEIFQGEISHRRALVLEVIVVLLILIEVVLGVVRTH